MSTLRSQNLSGACEVTLADDGRVKKVWLALEGRLESFRSKELSSRRSDVAHRKLQRMQQDWLVKIQALGARRYLETLQRECAVDGLCISVTATAKRKITIRDHKDIETAVDHQVIDALVRSGIFVNDDTGNVETGEMLCEPAERYLLGGRECLILSFARSGRPCRKTITERVLAHGWPDPRTEHQKREARKP